MAKDGLRTICIAYRDYVPSKAEKNQVHYDLSTEPSFDALGEDNVIANMTCVCIVGIEVRMGEGVGWEKVRREVIRGIVKMSGGRENKGILFG